MNSPVPTLGPDKWIYDPRKKLTVLFFYARTANHSQSNDQPDGVCSITAICAEYAMDITGLISNLETRLTKYLEPYFDTVTVEVTDSTTDAEASKRTINLDVSVVQEGEYVSLGAVLSGSLDGSSMFTLDKITDKA